MPASSRFLALHPDFAASLAAGRIPRPGDPEQARHGQERWRHEAGKIADPELRARALSVADTPEGQSLLAALTGNSAFLGHLLTRDPVWGLSVLEQGCDAPFAALMAGLREAHDRETDMTRLMSGLRRAKRRAALLIALADIAGIWSLEQVTGALCDVAETSLDLGAALLLRKAVKDGMLILPDPDAPLRGSGLIILGMGKLGARELNYSSDIDLIVLYDDAIVQTPRPEHLARTFIRLTRDLVRIMDERTQDGYVFRTDLRLRPDPASTPLAVSVSAAEIYYGSVGQNWERAAMIKARPVAGDREAGAAFLKLLRPYVWRRNLDFAAIQDIHSIKRQINAHKGHKTITVNGHDLKLGRGGIREVEFFAQTQQLIYGGRDDSLRISATVRALHALVAAGRVAAQTAQELEAAYRFLRTVEHRIQMVDDQQTHRMPESDAGVAALATFLGFADPDALRTTLIHALSTVEDHYADLFEEADSLSSSGNLVFTGGEDDPATLATLRQMGYANPAGVGAVVRGWHHGRYRCTRSVKARELLTELIPALLTALSRTPQPDSALMKLDAFLGRLPTGVQLFSLFQANPRLLDLVAEIMGAAPRLADTLSSNPVLLDGVLSLDFFDPLPDATVLAPELDRLLAEAEGFEDILLLARRWTNDQRFRAGIHILRHVTDGDRCGPFLADVAALVLERLLAAVHEEFARRHGVFPGGRVVVVGMGKLGERQMSVGSDLDLIIIYALPAGLRQSDGARPLSPAEYYGKLTQRLISAITAPTGEGRLYEVDMRLRPSGNAGPLAVSLESFVAYQAEQAWTWEHMALTRARVVAGDPTLAEDVTTAIRNVLTRPRDPERLLADVAAMRRRIEQEFGTANPWSVKHARGGMIDAEFVAQYLLLRHGNTHPAILGADMATALERLADAGCLESGVAATLAATLRLWRSVQAFIRLTTQGELEPGSAPPALLAALARIVPVEPGESAEKTGGSRQNSPDFPRADATIRRAAAAVRAAYESLIESPAAALPPAEEKGKI